MPWVLIPLVAIIAWAIVERSKNLSAGGGDVQRVLDDLLRRLEEAEAERRRLAQRVEHLEAIVTDEGWELDREARAALGGGTRPPLSLPDTHDAPEAEATRTRPRQRE